MTISYDDESILICAVRYCIGRQNYIVGSCDRWLRDRWTRLSAGTRDTILKDIQAALEQERLGHRSLGMEMDRDVWAALYRDMSPGGSLAHAAVTENAPARRSWCSLARWRHRRRRTEYEVLTSTAEAQCSTGPIEEGDHVTVYQGDEGNWWVRKTAEFQDLRRFERIDLTEPLK